MNLDIVARNRRAVAGGSAVLAVLAAGWFAWQRGHEDPVTSEGTADGVVRTVTESAMTSICEVELREGGRVRVACAAPAPKPGDAVTLRALHHRSAAVTYFLPREERGRP